VGASIGVDIQDSIITKYLQKKVFFHREKTNLETLKRCQMPKPKEINKKIVFMIYV
jgi:hypothetical protein